MFRSQHLHILILCRLLVVFAVLESVNLVHLGCEKNGFCEISALKSKEELFVHQYILNDTEKVNYRYVDLETLDSTFFQAVPKHVTSINIYKSKKLKSILTPQQSSVSLLYLLETGLRRIEFNIHNSIIELFVGQSDIVKIPETIRLLSESVKIEMTQCFIQVLDIRHFCDLSKLRTLNFFTNRINQVINSAKKNCTLYGSLETLILSHNLLKTINMELLSPFQNLFEVTFHESVLETVIGHFKTNASLSLMLSKNKIKVIDFCKWNVPHLIFLHLHQNELITVPSCLERLDNLEAFSLESNRLQNVSIESFAMMHTMKKLDLHNNSITSIVLHSHRYPNNLEYLGISENNLTYLDLSLVSVPSLEIDVSKNLISSIDVATISKNVTKLIMTSNPIDCSWETPEQRINVQCTQNNETE
ncbi:leucine-rich repeat-containing protein 40-like [Anopheles gambiae]|uniref:leucine-rich repeat-containing protein 40-like n=1 Tax=Anopheles gambiae TaxID=7165 RepID=UPI002AC8FD84|nr:leucine-rich repeat-containing protein 40-like [Anopheles gambiae]